jgi:RimJ/RimL family protein N-acetyltransferase
MPSTITTERLVLRPYEAGDLDDSIALTTDPDVMRFVGDGVMTRDRAAELFGKIFGIYERNEWEIWAAVSREDGLFVGHVEIKPRHGAGDHEIVYVLAPRAWGRGYATEIAAAVVRYGFDVLGYDRVSATVDPGNAPSIRILEKVGMRKIDEISDELGITLVYAIDRQ